MKNKMGEIRVDRIHEGKLVVKRGLSKNSTYTCKCIGLLGLIADIPVEIQESNPAKGIL